MLDGRSCRVWKEKLWLKCKINVIHKQNLQSGYQIKKNKYDQYEKGKRKNKIFYIENPTTPKIKIIFIRKYSVKLQTNPKNKIYFLSIYWYSYIAYSNITSEKNLGKYYLHLCQNKDKINKNRYKNLRINQGCERIELRTITYIEMN